MARIDLGADHRGLSGLTRAGDRLWAVPERTGTLLSFDADGGHQRSLPIDGLAAGVDLESIAWIGGDRFAAGTEGRRDGRSGDAVLVLEVTGDRARVVDRVELDYAELAVASIDNEGIEGLCVVGDVWLAAFETPVTITTDGGDRRVARIARIDARTRRITPLSLALTSATGKIAALDCRADGANIRALAVERHFETVRILAFSIAATAPSDDLVEPTIAADLTSIRRDTDNPEGIVRDGDGAVLLILDNHYGDTVTATELVRVTLATP